MTEAETDSEATTPEPPKEVFEIPFIVSSKDTYVTATSYLSLAEADTYMQTSSLRDNWSDFKDEAKKVLLNEASLYLNSMRFFSGGKTDDNQLLAFPRCDEETIPAEIKYAMRVAIELVLSNTGGGNVMSHKVGDITVKLGSSNIEKYSNHLKDILRPLMRGYIMEAPWTAEQTN